MRASCSSVRPLSAARLALLAAVMLLLAGCGGSTGGNDGGTVNTTAVSQPGELTAFVQQRLRRLNAEGQLGTAAAGSDLLPGTAMPTAAPAAAAGARSSTLVQEAGVDEADLLQSDGHTLYSLQTAYGTGPTVTAYQRGSDGHATRLAALQLPLDGASSMDSDGMHMSDDQRTLAVVGRAWTLGPPPAGCTQVCISLLPYWVSSSVSVQRVDVSNPAAVALGERVQIDGTLVDSRRIGQRLVLVSTWRPTLAPLVLPAHATAADRDAAIASVSAADLLPRLRRNGASREQGEPLLAETDCYVREGNASTDVQLTTVTVFDLSSPTLAQRSRCFVGGTEALYMSAGNLYLATTRWAVPNGLAGFAYAADIRTDIHKFALNSAADGGAVSYRGSGSVAGHLGWDREKTPYRFSEHNGDLRVLSFTGSLGWFSVDDASRVAASPATLTVLRERSSDQSLQAVATLPNSARPAALGKPGEQIYAVRFLGDRAYLVTFRRTDPLYVLDLADPADPKAVGELDVAGFSEYLFPLPGGQLLGVGRDADSTGRATGLKFAIFDVSDPVAPSQRAALSIGGAGSYTALGMSRHGLNLLQVGNVARVAVPAIIAGPAYGDYHHGLLKLEVDSSAGTIRSLGLGGADNQAYAALWQERSLQIGEQLYYLGNGTLSTLSW